MAGNMSEGADSLEHVMAGLSTNTEAESTVNSSAAGQLRQYPVPLLPNLDPFQRSLLLTEDVISCPAGRRVQHQAYSQEQQSQTTASTLRKG